MKKRRKRIFHFALRFAKRSSIPFSIFHCIQSLCWLCMLLGCGGSRKAAVEREVVRMDSLSVVRRDSLWMVRRLEASVGRLLEVRHVTFAPPDTSGVQHVASLTLATSASGGQYAAGEAARSGSETEAAVRSEAEVAERVRTARRRPRFPYVLLLAGILGFALLRSVKK